VHDGSWIDAEGARRFDVAYDAMGIRDDSHPPAALIDAAREARIVAASTLERAIASARRLAPHIEPETTPLLRELRFDIPRWGPRLPVNVWDRLHYWIWTARMARDFENDETERAFAAADWLEERAASGLVVAVTHGMFRRLLRRELVRRGWSGRELGGFQNWSAWDLSRV
jgi:broad specificity phosphatase PhoE